MLVDKELIAIGDVLIGRINYDFNTKYSAFYALKTLFIKSRQDIVKLSKKTIR